MRGFLGVSALKFKSYLFRGYTGRPSVHNKVDSIVKRFYNVQYRLLKVGIAADLCKNSQVLLYILTFFETLSYHR